MITLKGIIERITFRNEATGFTVFHLKTAESSLLISCVGNTESASIGLHVTLQGNWESHKRFGKQFSFLSVDIVPPDTTDGVLRLLSSGLISNLGPVRSKAIVDKFGMSTFEILDKEPERLREVSGIGKKTQEKIIKEWNKQRYLRNLTTFLQEFDISISMIYKIGKAYGADARKKITENPYSLIDDIRGVGFIKADCIAQKMGYEHESVQRIRAGIIFTLQESLGEGHVCLPRELLITKSSGLLDVGKEKIVFTIDNCLETQSLLNDGEFIYLPFYYHTERNVAANIRSRLDYFDTARLQQFTEEEIASWMKKYESDTGWVADPLQNKAIIAAVRSPLLILTGGPGTGKTTILKVVVTFFRQKELKIILAAPTGRAAERMSKVTGESSKTIHRLLEYKPGSATAAFQRNESNPLDTDVVIIDEFSMVDLVLLRHLLDALPVRCSIIVIGDNNQLPSVGAGNVLSDLIGTNAIMHVHLSTVFRQAASSRIVTSAHEVIEGLVPEFSNAKSDNCFFIEKQDPAECAECIADLVARRLPEKYGFDPINDIQVISPMHKGFVGTQYLNTLLQNTLNKNSKKLEKGSCTYFLGDKVMQIKNNYETGIFNGDIGIITDIIDESELVVDFSGTIVEYNPIMLDEIQGAYCISIHKSQGSEYRAVIIPVSTQHYVMLQRNLLYTALTRAKSLCVLVGTKKAFSIAINNNKALQRYSLLSDLLQEKR